MTFGAPQIIMTCIQALALGINLVKEKDKPVDLALSVIAPILTVGLLYWGGFYGN